MIQWGCWKGKRHPGGESTTGRRCQCLWLAGLPGCTATVACLPWDSDQPQLHQSYWVPNRPSRYLYRFTFENQTLAPVGTTRAATSWNLYCGHQSRVNGGSSSVPRAERDVLWAVDIAKVITDILQRRVFKLECTLIYRIYITPFERPIYTTPWQSSTPLPASHQPCAAHAVPVTAQPRLPHASSPQCHPQRTPRRLVLDMTPTWGGATDIMWLQDI